MPNTKKIVEALRDMEQKAQIRRRFEDMINLNQPQNQDVADVGMDIAAGFVPGIAQAQAARDFERARRSDDVVGMGLSSLAAAPIVGGVAKAANVARKAKPIQEIAEAAVTAGKMSPQQVSELADAERLADANAIAKQVALNSKRAEGSQRILLKNLESDLSDFRHDDVRAELEHIQGLLQSRTQQNNPIREKVKAAYQYSNSIGGLMNPEAQMSPSQRKVLAGILKGEIAYDEAGDLRRIK